MPGWTLDTRWSTEAPAEPEADPLPPKERARLGPLTLSFLSAGGGSGPLLLWLHGFPHNAYLWRRCLALAAASGFRSLAPDLPGLGESAAPHSADYAAPAAAATIDELLSARGENDVRVVGAGVGAQFAMELAGRDSGRVTAVALCPSPPRALGAFRAACLLARWGAGELALAALGARRALDRLDPRQAAAADSLERDLALRPLLATPESRGRTLAFLAAQRPAETPILRVPVLVCDSDGGASVVGDEPNVRRVRLPDSAVRLAAHRAEVLLDVLLPFLRQP